MRTGTPPHHAGATLARRLLGLVGPLALALGAVAVLAVACGPARAPGGASAGIPGGAPGGAPSLAPSVAGSVSPGSPGPKPTNWPTLTVEATVALGAANGEFRKMADDVAAALDSQDPARILAAINNSLEFLTGNQKNIPRLQADAATKSVGDRLAVVYTSMIDGATKVRDGLTSGDGNAVTLGFQTFFAGATEYATVSPDLADIAQQAVLMQRLLAK